MALNIPITDVFEDNDDLKQGRWLEIEGLPFAFGTFQASSGFFSSRAAPNRFLGIAHSMKARPRSIEQKLDVLQGGAETSGQVEFEIVDVPASGLSAVGSVDGSPIQWTGIGYSNGARLSAAITAAATTIPILGSTAGFTAGQYAYIGTEAILIGAVGASSLTGCTRARFKSVAKAFPIGMPVTNRPTIMANRRCWYYQVAVNHQAGETLTGQGASANNQLLRFAGVLRNLRLKDGEHGTFTFPARTIDQELDHEAFRTFRKFKIRGTSIMDGSGKKGFVTAPGLPGFNNSRANNSIYNVQATDGFVDDEWALVKIGDEYFIGQFQSSIGGSFDFVISKRGVFNSPMTEHPENSWAQECVVLGKNSTQQDFFKCSKFTSAATVGSPLNADHPLLLLLQILLSTGDGTNYAGGSARNYDVLPAEWGMGVNYTRIDIQGIEAVAAEEPSLRWGGVVTAPVNFIAMMRQMLAFAGYYYFSDLQDLLKMKRCRPPLPDESAIAITDERRIRTHKTGWDGNWSGAVREVVFRYNFNIATGKFEETTVFITAADVYAKGLARSMKYESSLVYNGAPNVPGSPPLFPWDVNQWLLTRRDFYRLRYGRPPAIVTERVDVGLIRPTIGDIVSVLHDNLPNETTGARGMNSIGEVIGREFDDATNTIVLRILMTGYQLGDYRFIAPTLQVKTSAGMDDSNFSGTYELNKFTATAGPTGLSQTDGLIEVNSYGASGVGQSLVFPSDVRVRIWTSDFYDYIEGVLTSMDGVGNFSITNLDGNSFQGLTGTDFGGTYALVGAFITFADFDDVWNTVLDEGATVSERYGFGADSNDQLGSGNFDPHIFFPT